MLCNSYYGTIKSAQFKSEALTWVEEVYDDASHELLAKLKQYAYMTLARRRSCYFAIVIYRKSLVENILIKLKENYGKRDLLEFEGVVDEILPNAMFRVTLEKNVQILAHTAGKMRKHRIRFWQVTKLRFQMTPYDLTKGRIILRHK